jgi:hypothetical protein
MTLALEINDVGLVLVRDGEIVAEEPGCAMLDGRSVETGAVALRAAKLSGRDAGRTSARRRSRGRYGRTCE